MSTPLPEIGLVVVLTTNGVEAITACERAWGHPVTSKLYSELAPVIGRLDAEARAVGERLLAEPIVSR